jgi:putative glutamine amidotransferase
MTERRPVIGLNMDLMTMEDPLRAKAFCYLHYIDAVAAAGGLPLLIPPYRDAGLLDQALDAVDGFCFIGGDDYDPAHYGGHAQPADQLMPARRHAFDIALAQRVLARTAAPALGICGGHQLFNVALGGALVQDVASEWRPVSGATPVLKHANDERLGTPEAGDIYRHEVRIQAGSLLSRVVGGTSLRVNSWHHQAIDPGRVGRGLVATAWSTDGVIEAVELEPGAGGGRFLLGVQWYPERRQDEAQQRAIFTALIEAARTPRR